MRHLKPLWKILQMAKSISKEPEIDYVIGGSIYRTSIYNIDGIRLNVGNIAQFGRPYIARCFTVLDNHKEVTVEIPEEWIEDIEE